MRVLGLVPGHMKSKRLPGKIALSCTGKPLISYAAETLVRCDLINDVALVLDSESIDTFEGSKLLQDFPVVRVDDANCGTDRCAKAMLALGEEKFDYVVNLQADEPEIGPDKIDKMIMSMHDHLSDMSTLTASFADGHSPMSENVVKVVTDHFGNALYFTRQDIPGAFRHIGCYGYTVVCLKKFAGTDRSFLETQENLEQLRAVEMLGSHIVCTHAGNPPASIDTMEDYNAFVDRHPPFATQKPSPELN